MFNVTPRVDVPGFRVRPVKDPPGFDIDENGLPRRNFAGTFGGPPPNVGPYGGGLMPNVVPQASVPGFRVGLVDDTPDFLVGDNAPRSRSVVQSGSVGASEIMPSAPLRSILGALLPHAQRGAMEASGNQGFFGQQLSMTDASKHSQCVERCYPLLLRPKPYPWSDLNQWDYLKCYNMCMSE